MANLGNGNDIGSVDLAPVSDCDSLTGMVEAEVAFRGCWPGPPPLSWDPGPERFSGLSSHKGVPGRLPSETSSAPATDPLLGLKL